MAYTRSKQLTLSSFASTMDKICVDLYGGRGLFGGRERPLEADVIHCDNCDNCSIYKDGHCLRRRAFMEYTGCKYGSVSTVGGYTSRAKKYREFKETYENDPTYRKLTYPSGTSFASIGDYYFISLTYASINIGKETGKYYVETEAWVAKRAFFILKEDLTAELLHKLLSAKPRALMGGVIDDYQKKCVPNFVCELRRLSTELFAELCKIDNKYLDYVPDYRGRWARIDTLVIGSKLEDCHGNKYTLSKDDDGKIFMEGYMTHAVPFFGKNAFVKVYPTDGQTIQVKDSSWCDENTKFE